MYQKACYPSNVKGGGVSPPLPPGLPNWSTLAQKSSIKQIAKMLQNKTEKKTIYFHLFHISSLVSHNENQFLRIFGIETVSIIHIHSSSITKKSLTIDRAWLFNYPAGYPVSGHHRISGSGFFKTGLSGIRPKIHIRPNPSPDLRTQC